MKNIHLFAIFIYILISSCSSEKLDREKAFQLIKENRHYPKAAPYYIFTADPKFARKMLDAGLEDDGMLKITRTQKLSEVGNPLIGFTDKAKPYLLETSEKDRADKIQLVKLADENLEEITGIQMLDGDKKAVVEYTTSYKNPTPFAVLAEHRLKEKKEKIANFSLYDDGWRLED